MIADHIVLPDKTKPIVYNAVIPTPQEVDETIMAAHHIFSMLIDVSLDPYSPWPTINEITIAKMKIEELHTKLLNLKPYKWGV